MSKQAAVIGAGRWGRALAHALGNNGCSVSLWSRSTKDDAPVGKGVELTADLTAALASETLFLAVPPAHVRSLLRGASEHIRSQHRVLHLVRGLEPGGARVSQIIEQETRALKTGALAGPIVPEELNEEVASAAVVASPFQEVIDDVTAMLAGPRLRVYGTLDQTGVEVGSALRTSVALAAGMARELSPGGSSLAVLLTRSLAEGARLVEAMGGQTRDPERPRRHGRLDPRGPRRPGRSGRGRPALGTWRSLRSQRSRGAGPHDSGPGQEPGRDAADLYGGGGDSRRWGSATSLRRFDDPRADGRGRLRSQEPSARFLRSAAKSSKAGCRSGIDLVIMPAMRPLKTSCM